ncbi:hypothetical protein PENTCL1PPCAC_29274 [Pristionchus entomophagus]|uniref:Uncharacterized protein n=1 Tax=Pristionchus entomophagus TaxID=358040 RepID=A0AAV5UJ88_9BILA|nr:hypothetical protein PENTCL1PPCAC_29274 [Pristionchus entomophagus]
MHGKWMRIINDRLDLKEQIEIDLASYLTKNGIKCSAHIKPKLDMIAEILEDRLSDLDSDDDRRID